MLRQRQLLVFGVLSFSNVKAFHILDLVQFQTPPQSSSSVFASPTQRTVPWDVISTPISDPPEAPTIFDSCPYESFTATTSLNTGSASVTFLPVTNCYCNCGPTMTPQYWGTNSDKSSTSWCQFGTAAPSDYTFVSQGCMPTST